jgi:hypothetical protein
LARPQHDAVAAESDVVAHLPLTALDDHGRCSVVEAHATEVGHWAVRGESAADEVLLLIEGDLRGGERRGGRAHEAVIQTTDVFMQEVR